MPRRMAADAKRLRHVAEEVDAESRERAVYDHAAHSTKPRQTQRETRRHEHHCREQGRQNKQRVEIELVAVRRESRLLCILDEARQIPERHRIGRRKALLNARRRERGRQCVCGMMHGRLSVGTAHPCFMQSPHACRQHRRFCIDASEKVVLRAVQKDNDTVQPHPLMRDAQCVDH
jgi:hypothetical protein